MLCNSMYCVKSQISWKLETSEKMRKNEKITCGVIHGVHISLFGGEGLFYPPPHATYKNLTNAVCMDSTLCIDYTLHKLYLC